MTEKTCDAGSAGAFTLISDGPEETRAIGRAIGAALAGGEIVCLNGGLGAGKTHLAQGIAAGAGISGPVSSPTFTLINEYEGRLSLAHFDFYRLERPDELDDIGFDEYLDGVRVVVIEWADRFPERLPARRLDIDISIGGERRRILRVAGPDNLLRRVEDSLRGRGDWIDSAGRGGGE